MPTDEEFRACLAALRVQGLQSRLAEHWWVIHLQHRQHLIDYNLLNRWAFGDRPLPESYKD
jgi:hypothetical protein